MYVCMHVCMYVCMCEGMFIHIYLYIYVCIYIYSYISECVRALGILAPRILKGGTLTLQESPNTHLTKSNIQVG